MLQTCAGILMLICLTLKATSFRIFNPGNPASFVVDESRISGCTLLLKKISTRRQVSIGFLPMTEIVAAFDSRDYHEHPKIMLLQERICRRSASRISMDASHSDLKKNSGHSHLNYQDHGRQITLGASNYCSDSEDSLMPVKLICDKENHSSRMVESEASAATKEPGCLHGAAGEEVSTRVPFLGGWAETFPDMVERGAGLGRSGAAHCRIPFLFGTQRRPAALAILAPPESTSLYTRIPFLSGSVRPPRSTVQSLGSPASDRRTLVEPPPQEQPLVSQPSTTASPEVSYLVQSSNQISGEVAQERWGAAAANPVNGDNAADRNFTARSVVPDAARAAAASSGESSTAAVEAQLESEHVASRARRAAAAALDLLRQTAASRLNAANRHADAGAAAGALDHSRAACVFDLEAECCQDMRAENMNRTVVKVGAVEWPTLAVWDDVRESGVSRWRVRVERHKGAVVVGCLVEPPAPVPGFARALGSAAWMVSSNGMVCITGGGERRIVTDEAKRQVGDMRTGALGFRAGSVLELQLDRARKALTVWIDGARRVVLEGVDPRARPFVNLACPGDSVTLEAPPAPGRPAAAAVDAYRPPPPPPPGGGAEAARELERVRMQADAYWP
uniref:NHR domain-containing protein n=1 Tax=Cryptomonas curvata TaxID=233186 RepID=A0A7S0MXC1_9CRYP|mmetsp:Transcript_54632/g.114179  ORF Transcript_54632/g.114179 Transcript_54632/m.114179 type:complete len:621 (+) Transcript_54632:320-2182(+)